MNNETKEFKLFDWDTKDWIDLDKIEEVLQFNWVTSGEDETIGIIWGEVKQNKNVEMVFNRDENGIFIKPE